VAARTDELGGHGLGPSRWDTGQAGETKVVEAGCSLPEGSHASLGRDHRRDSIPLCRLLDRANLTRARLRRHLPWAMIAGRIRGSTGGEQRAPSPFAPSRARKGLVLWGVTTA